MEDQRLKYLLEKYSKNKASESEISELNKYIADECNELQIKEFIAEMLEKDNGENPLSKEVSNDILVSIFESTQESKYIFHLGRQKNYSGVKWTYWMTAAMVTLVLGGLIYLWMPTNFNNIQESFTTIQDYPPGKDQAVLTLWDGTHIQLTDDLDNKVLYNSGLTINSSEGEIISNSFVPTQGYNTLVTPLGGQYKLVLPDGSRAWLNAGSSIRFPTTFYDSVRSVVISGEVYFEIQPNKQKPFFVQVKNEISGNEMEVKVLGTHFNISSYPDDPTINTTLVEGSIEIRKGETKKLLSAGQQARIRNNAESQQVLIETVNTENVIAWKEGVFEFNGNLQDILRQISRWYNVEVKYENEISNRAFIGTIARDNKISEVLKILELTGEVKFEIEENTVIVKPNNNLNL